MKNQSKVKVCHFYKEKLKNALEVIEAYQSCFSDDQLKSENWIDWHHLELLQDEIDKALKEKK